MSFRKKKWLLLSWLIFIFPAISYAQSKDSTNSQYGWLEFKSNVDSLYVVVNNHFTNAVKIGKDDSLKYKAGDYNFTFVNAHYADINMPIVVKPNKKLLFLINFSSKIVHDHNKSGYKRIIEGIPYNLTLITDSTSTIVVDDSTYGKHYLRADVGPGYHTILLKNTTAYNHKRRIYIEPSGQVSLSIYDRPLKKTAHILSIIPGASQLYKNQKSKGAIFISGTVGGIVFSQLFEAIYKYHRKQYHQIYAAYLQQTNEKKAQAYGAEAQHKYNLVESDKRLRDIALTTAANFYVMNIIDAFLSIPRSGYRIKMKISPDVIQDQTSMKLSMNINF